MKILDQSQMADFGSSQDSGGSVNSYRNVLKGSIFDINPSQLHISGSLGGTMGESPTSLRGQAAARAKNVDIQSAWINVTQVNIPIEALSQGFPGWWNITIHLDPRMVLDFKQYFRENYHELPTGGSHGCHAGNVLVSQLAHLGQLLGTSKCRSL